MTNMEKIKQLTFGEKARLLTGEGFLTTMAVPRLDIPMIEMADGPHGLRHAKATPCTIEGGCVCFPTASAASATWNRELIYKMGQGIARDCLEEKIDVILGPGINIKRTPVCGRNFEYFSEDPFVSGELGTAYINGVQSCGVGTSLKHFAANSQEIDRKHINAEIDERTLREIYLTGFEMAIKNAKPLTVMNAYNKLNAIWCTENSWLLKDVLREEWGFDGAVISDWGAVHNIALALKNGTNLQMPTNTNIENELRVAMENGIITEEEIDQALLCLLDFIDRVKALPKEETVYDRDAQHKIAKEIADEAITLLRNEDNILPIDTEKYKKIGVFGNFAKNPMYMGGGSSKVFASPEYIETPYEFIEKYVAGKSELSFYELFDKKWIPDRGDAKGEARKHAPECDLAIVFVGRLFTQDTEDLDLYDLRLENYMDKCIETICEGCENVILVLQSGSAIIPGSWKNKVKGIVDMWLCGEAGGSAIADVLFGKVNPSGKLSETFAYNINPLLDYPGDGLKVTYPEQWRVGYRYFDLHPEQIWYPFGYGLSYTTFEYSDLKLSSEKATSQDIDLTVSFKVKNTGKVAGKESVQLYVSHIDSIISKPIKELKEFDKVYLEPGEEKEVVLHLNKRSFAYYSVNLHDWCVESGEYKILIGASSQDIRLEHSFLVADKHCYTISDANAWTYIAGE